MVQEKPSVTVLHVVWPVPEFVEVPGGHVEQLEDCEPLTEYVPAGHELSAALLEVVHAADTYCPGPAVEQDVQPALVAPVPLSHPVEE